MRTGIYIDFDNVRSEGLGTINYDVLRDYYAASGSVMIMRAYSGRDELFEEQNPKFADWKQYVRVRMSNAGFKLFEKPVKRYQDDQGNSTTKSNVDVDLTVDVMLHHERLDRVVLMTGDGDFVRLVQALQDKGIYVEVVASRSPSSQLVEAANHYLDGRIIPNILPRSAFAHIMRVTSSDLRNRVCEVRYLTEPPKTTSPNDSAWVKKQIKLTDEMIESKNFYPGRTVGWTGGASSSSYFNMDNER